MKKLLFILIAIGVLFGILYLTGYMAQTEELKENVAVSPEAAPVLPEGKSCYEYDHAEAVVLYSVHEELTIIKTGNSITGIKSGTQTGPEMTNGYAGSLAGTMDGNIITVIFSYVIEGSSQAEKEIYAIQDNALVKYRYPLNEENGVLVPDVNSEHQSMVYKKVSCSVS